MNKLLSIIILSAAMVFPYIVLEYIMQPIYPNVLMSLLTPMIMLLPLMVFSIYGLREGLVVGFVFSVSLLTFNVLYTYGQGYNSILVFGLLVNPISAGIASSNMNKKHIFPIYLFLSIVIQLFFRTVLAI